MGNNKRIGDIPELRAEIIAMGQAQLSTASTACPHRIFGPSHGSWDLSSVGKGVRQVHECKDCQTSRCICNYEFSQLP
ncbi:MAG: hypothetical protein WCV50_05425 [Patescibacteria group bacterium]